jgi:uncharacterized membrane protein
MLYDLVKSAHIVAIVVWFGGTMAAVLATCLRDARDHSQICSL